MNARALFASLLVTGNAALAQGFAGLGAPAPGFAEPNPARSLSFPADHGAHPTFRVEWWYLTANLTGEDGQTFGVQWTLFRTALAPTGAPGDQIWMGHAAISAPGHRYWTERLSRGDIGTAGVAAQPFEAFIDEWEMKGPTLSDIEITAQGTDFAYDLYLFSEKPFVPEGMNGYAVKSAKGNASRYYSQPFYRAEGTLTLPAGKVNVSGLGWLDREWSSQGLAAGQTGWDWMGLHLESGAKVMVYRLRDKNGDIFLTGNWITAEGATENLQPGSLEMTPLETAVSGGVAHPVRWRVAVQEHGLDVVVTAIYPDSRMPTSVPYWEGPVHVNGTQRGVGYLEMTGYE